MTWWHDLNTPDAYRDDWYGELVNQCGHTLLGCVSAVTVCMVFFAFAGEMPYRTAVVALCIGAYLAVELFAQGWRAGDAWFDSLMFSAGVGGAVLPFREASVHGWTATLQFDPRLWAAIAGPWSVMLFLRVRRRYIASQVTQSQ